MHPMFGIGSVARLAQVSVRTLRYYDEIGLLRPVWVDPATGYRWYEAGQLHRLHRILALRDLGVRLAEIARLLDDDVTVADLRGILLLRRAEAHDRLTAEAERLARVDARLHQMEEPMMTAYEVVVKSIEPERVVAITEEVASVEGIGAVHARLWPRLHEALEELGLERVAPSIAVETGENPIRFTAALPVPHDVRVAGGDVVALELPGIARAATTVMYGTPDFDAGFEALRAWIGNAGERAAGELREVYLDCDGPRSTWVVELQLALNGSDAARPANA
jgi:DNA-binding transcriptional MerR regulator